MEKLKLRTLKKDIKNKIKDYQKIANEDEKKTIKKILLVLPLCNDKNALLTIQKKLNNLLNTNK